MDNIEREEEYKDEYREEYKERDDNNTKKIIIIILILLLLLLGLFFLIKFLFFNQTKEEILLNAGKEYYKDEAKLPYLEGDCYTVSLKELKSEGVLKKVNKFKKCDDEETYVKVCKLESGKIHYVPLLSCTNYKSDDLYKDFVYGEESDIIEDESDVLFKYVPMVINKDALGDISEEEVLADENTHRKYLLLSETKVYSYRDMTWQWKGNVKKYYPNGETDPNKVTYTSKTAPSSEYNLKGEAANVKYYSKGSTPTSCTSKTEFSVVSASTYEAAKKVYHCWSPDLTTEVKSWTPCAERTPALTVKSDPTYVCGTSVNGTPVASNYKCNATCASGLTLSNDRGSCGKYVCPKVWGDWSKTACSGSDCKTKTETEYKWYKLVDGSTSEYYAKAPYPGLVKAGEGKWGEWSKFSTTKYVASETREVKENTLLKIKPVPEDNEKYWQTLSDTPVTLEEMIKIFNDNNYAVETLNDIYEHNMIRYGIVLQYRNKE